MSEDGTRRVSMLMVEDNPEHMQLCVEFLPSAEFSIDTATNGADAVGKAKMKQYDIILLDYQLPDTNGIELLKTLKPLQKDAMIILATSMDDPDLSYEAMNLGASDYIIKSYEYYRNLKERIMEAYEDIGSRGAH